MKGRQGSVTITASAIRRMARMRDRGLPVKTIANRYDLRIATVERLLAESAT